jgi:hypothetical protein
MAKLDGMSIQHSHWQPIKQSTTFNPKCNHNEALNQGVDEYCTNIAGISGTGAAQRCGFTPVHVQRTMGVPLSGHATTPE